MDNLDKNLKNHYFYTVLFIPRVKGLNQPILLRGESPGDSHDVVFRVCGKDVQIPSGVESEKTDAVQVSKKSPSSTKRWRMPTHRSTSRRD